MSLQLYLELLLKLICCLYFTTFAVMVILWYSILFFSEKREAPENVQNVQNQQLQQEAENPICCRYITC